MPMLTTNPVGAVAAVYFWWFGYGFFYSRAPGHV